MITLQTIIMPVYGNCNITNKEALALYIVICIPFILQLIGRTIMFFTIREKPWCESWFEYVVWNEFESLHDFSTAFFVVINLLALFILAVDNVLKLL